MEPLIKDWPNAKQQAHSEKRTEFFIMTGYANKIGSSKCRFVGKSEFNSGIHKSGSSKNRRDQMLQSKRATLQTDDVAVKAKLESIKQTKQIQEQKKAIETRDQQIANLTKSLSDIQTKDRTVSVTARKQEERIRSLTTKVNETRENWREEHAKAERLVNAEEPMISLRGEDLNNRLQVIQLQKEIEHQKSEMNRISGDLEKLKL
jgi:hypothetical protein